ncbi:TPA: AAA family ATPase [Pseudomonas aeruginosa]
MIKSIERIRNLGVYHNYIKPAGTKEFAAKNLIYGWNYSGKTTLSRLFAQIEERLPHADFQNCEFTFNSGSEAVTEKNFHECGLSVRVFNSDFVRNNLFFDSGSCNPILLLGKESEEAQKKINALNERITKCQKTNKTISRKVEACTVAIQEEKKRSAQNIRQRLKIDPYTATHLGSDLIAVNILDSQLLSEKDLVDAIDLALTPDSNKPSQASEITATPSIASLHREAISVLAATPSFSNTIKHLEKNPEIERWVETGLHLHPEAGPCEFCGNKVTSERLESFRSHFSKDLADHNGKVQDLLDRVIAAEFKLDLPSPVELNTQFREAYKAACVPLADRVKAFNDAVNTLVTEITSKVESSRKTMEPLPLAPGLEQAIQDTAKAINSVIKENNKLAANFVSVRAAALKKAKYHFVQETADKLESEGWERKKNLLTKRADRVRAFNVQLQNDVVRLQAEISQAQQGRERINERLVLMLGSEAIQIKVTKDTAGQERFQLVRKNGAVAKNLSDGERTAIAFSYFLTKLKELTHDDFKEAIVYIDDPISSLDSNHIFQITAAINEMFFSKIKQPNGSEAWGTTCKQLFISTHNFEFFNLIRELHPTKDQVARLFLIKRVDSDNSELINMPNSLSNYNSEYQFLFDCLHKFHFSTNKIENENLIILPNALRRFLELYTYSRVPGTHSDTVDQRASELFGKERAKSILKFLHTFSHGNSIERITGNNELIFLLEETVKAVFNELQEKDERHWKALLSSTQT